MNPVNVFMSAVRVIWQNPTVVLRIFGFWIISSALLLCVMLGDSLVAKPGRSFNALLLFYFAFGFAALAGGLAMAINWHRFILLGEIPDRFVIFKAKGSRAQYLVDSIVIALISIIPVVVTTFCLGLITPQLLIFGPVGVWVALVLINFPYFVCFTFFGLALAVSIVKCNVSA